MPKRLPKLPDTGRFWLFKSEPSVFSFDDLLAAKGRRTHWDGVRNYQARNLLRDEIRKGDGVLFYHSSTKPLAIAGIARVAKAGYPDHTAFDESDPHYDPDSDPADPRWFMVDIEAVCACDPVLDRDQLVASPALQDMMLLRRGSRLSVQPVKPAEWRAVLQLAGL